MTITRRPLPSQTTLGRELYLFYQSLETLESCKNFSTPYKEKINYHSLEKFWKVLILSKLENKLFSNKSHEVNKNPQIHTMHWIHPICQICIEFSTYIRFIPCIIFIHCIQLLQFVNFIFHVICQVNPCGRMYPTFQIHSLLMIYHIDPIYWFNPICWRFIPLIVFNHHWIEPIHWTYHICRCDWEEEIKQHFCLYHRVCLANNLKWFHRHIEVNIRCIFRLISATSILEKV